MKSSTEEKIKQACFVSIYLFSYLLLKLTKDRHDREHCLSPKSPPMTVIKMNVSMMVLTPTMMITVLQRPLTSGL